MTRKQCRTRTGQCQPSQCRTGTDMLDGVNFAQCTANHPIAETGSAQETWPGWQRIEGRAGVGRDRPDPDLKYAGIEPTFNTVEKGHFWTPKFPGQRLSNKIDLAIKLSKLPSSFKGFLFLPFKRFHIALHR